MTKHQKPERFRKVVKYYYPNGDEYDGTAIGFYFIRIFLLPFYWIFNCMTYPYDYFKDIEQSGSRRVYYEEIKDD